MGVKWRVYRGRHVWWAESPDHTHAVAFPDHQAALSYALDQTKETTHA